MHKNHNIPPAENLCDHRTVVTTISKYIKCKASFNGAINILEAGCGRKWQLNLKGISYTLTGIDIDPKALDIRKNEQKDIDIAILADLRSVSIKENSYDFIYCENVLEHINGAEDVLRNFVSWLKPGGVMILIFPNRESTYAFVTRMTPFCVHVFYKKYIQGIKNAGKPGHDPYPVCFDQVVSRDGVYRFCDKYGLNMQAEYRMDGRPMNSRIIWFIARIILRSLNFISFQRLSYDHRNLVYFVEKL